MGKHVIQLMRLETEQELPMLGEEATLEPLLRRLRLRKVLPYIPCNSTVLDIGCGTQAAFLRAISGHIKYGIGIDFKVEALQTDTIKTLPLRLDAELPFAHEHFDVVTMLAVLEHLEYSQQVLREIHRVLKPNGILVLTVPSIWSKPLLEFLAYRLGVLDEKEIRDHKHYFTRDRLEKLLVHDARFRQFRHHYFQLGMNNFCIVVK